MKKRSKNGLSFLALTLLASTSIVHAETINLTNEVYPSNKYIYNTEGLASITDIVDINLSGNTFMRDAIGLRADTETNITDTLTINMTSGYVNDDLKASTEDFDEEDTLPALRNANIINFSGGQVGDTIQGGSGAQTNTINITGGKVGKCTMCGFQAGTIYAFNSNEDTLNKSINGNVNIDGTGDDIAGFLDSFRENYNGGMILGGNGAEDGKSTLSFNDVNDSYRGGFADFDEVNFNSSETADTENSVKLKGHTYQADNWNVNTKLDTNERIVSNTDEDNENPLYFNIREKGEMLSQIRTDVDIEVNNLGILNGIKAQESHHHAPMVLALDNSEIATQTRHGPALLKDITVNNSAEAHGEYEGDTVLFNNLSGGTLSEAEFINHTQGHTTINNEGTMGNVMLTNLNETKKDLPILLS